MEINLKKLFKDSFNVIKRYSKSGNDSIECVTVSENYYIIHKAYNEADKNFLKKENLYLICRRYLARNGWTVSGESFFDYFGKLNLSISDVYALDTILSCALIISASDEIKSFGEGGRCNSQKLISSVLALRKTGDIKTEECFGRLCATEKMLAEKIELYRLMAPATKNLCRGALMKSAKKSNLSETEYLERLKSRGESVYDIIEGEKRRPLKFFLAYALIFLAASFFSFAYFGPIAVFFLLPLYISAGAVNDKIFSRFFKALPPLRLGLTEIPDSAITLTVITTLLFGGEKDKTVFDSLEEFYLKNKKKNSYFGVLADLPDSKKPQNPEDIATISYAKDRVEKLNKTYGGVFSLFLRQRTLNEKDMVWTGKERKRGAVCDLVSAVKTTENPFFVTVNDAYLKKVKYIITLDRDTTLPLEGVIDLVNIMLHPKNRPVIEKGRVVKGYGILQPKMKTGLKPSYSTYYSLLRSEEGGFYESASYERYQTVLGSGVFCGKGMFDVDLFHSLVLPAFPPGKVLSHDIPEGCVLRCRYVPDTALTDSGPRNPVSYFSRLHRWIRGDAQNVIFFGSKIIGGGGKYKLLENLLRHLTPLFSAVGMLAASFLPGFSQNKAALLFLTLQSYNATYALLTVFSMLTKRAYTPRRFFSVAFSSTVRGLGNLALEFASVFEYATRAADAFARALWRLLFSKKRLMEWVTFTQSDVFSSGFLSHVSSLLASALAGTVLLVFSPYSVYRLTGLLVFLYPATSYLLSFRIKSNEITLSQGQKDELIGYASDAFKFFYERVGRETNYLPPDNVQLSPSDVTAERTSPSNIGLYLLSLAAANDFGFVNQNFVVSRTEKVFKTMRRLKRWNGHFYNWYDTRSTEVIGGGYVSTVDSGNLVTMLITFAYCLMEYSDPKAASLAAEALKMAEEADFTALYNKEKDLFWLGYSPKDGYGEICYDLLMSEIRTTCYFACAKGITPKAHWKSLSRAIVAKNGFIGMASWSGTSFEYFMPELFLPTFENSFIDESLSFAMYNQRSYKKDRVWGVSESGFYSFDSEMNYQYKAHGAPALALRKYRDGEFVVSPYSSFIMIQKGPEAVLKNLRALREHGMYGEYGFYEALDLSSEPGGVVRSYMTHHTGMILVACANACFDNIFKKRFTSDRAIASSYELLCEKIPTDVYLYPTGFTPPRKEKVRYPATEVQTDSSLAFPDAQIFQKGNLALVVSSDGRISMRFGSYIVNGVNFQAFSKKRGLCFAFGEKGVIRGCEPAGKSRFSFEKYSNGFAFISSDPFFPSLIRGSLSSDGKVFIFDTRADKKTTPEVYFYFEPVLERPENFNSHPTFSKLFIVSEFLPDKKIIVFRRRGKPASGRFPVLAVGLGDLKQDFSFCTDNEQGFSHMFFSPQNTLGRGREYDNANGVCINPACVIKTSPVPGGEARLIISAAYTEKECVDNVCQARRRVEVIRRGETLPALAEKAVSSSLFAKGVCAYHKSDASVLWKAGISGDYPLLTLGVYSESLRCAAGMLSAFRLLSTSFLRCELLFLTHEKGGYMSPLAAFIRDCVSEMGCERFLGRRGGVFIVNAALFSDDEQKFIKDFSSFYYETDSPPAPGGRSCPPPAEIIRRIDSGMEKITSGTESMGENTVKLSGEFRLPRSYVMAGHACGAVVTHKTLGFSFFHNARDKRITKFDGDIYSPAYGEELVFFDGGGVYDLVGISEKAEYEDGAAQYHGSVAGRQYTVRVFVSAKLPVKVICAEFCESPGRVGLCAFPQDKRSCFFPIAGGRALGFCSLESSSSGQINFIYTENGSYETDYYAFINGRKSGLCDAACVCAASQRQVFYLGASPSLPGAERVISALSKDIFHSELTGAAELARSFIPKFSLFSSSQKTNSLYTPFSPYQAAFSRFLGKTGFYQTGGAYGFRDQLQDCLCLVYSRPDVVRTHIARCAARQYIEGDVMHWWFYKRGKVYGIRTKCSDDLLFLPYTAADYIAKTGDTSLLGAEIAYLTSPPLETQERFESPERSEIKETLYRHCARAIERSASLTGERGLCLMGSCDWNDGFSAVGSGGRGESVFTTMFLGIVCRDFAEVCKIYGDNDYAEVLTRRYEEIKTKVLKIFTGDRFPRGTFDDGNFFGTEESEECKIDIISQCFASLLLGGTPETKAAMNTAYAKLFDGEKGIFKLFAPPFDKVEAGYISHYPPGVRENGGQYTHGALWGAWGFFACGEYEKACEVMEKITPVYHSDTMERAEIYKLEPYALSADIYLSGRGGWSWYTGSAAWYFKIMTEIVLGVKFSGNFSTLSVFPLVEYTLLVEKNNYKLKIIVSKDQQNMSLDGVPADFPIKVPPGEHVLRLKPIY